MFGFLDNCFSFDKFKGRHTRAEIKTCSIEQFYVLKKIFFKLFIDSMEVVLSFEIMREVQH